MGAANLVQPHVAGGDSPAYPAFAIAIDAGGGTSLHHFGKGGVAGDGESPPAQRARQRVREAESVERQDCPPPRLHPENFGIVAAVRHREDALAVGKHQLPGRNDRRCGEQVHVARLTNPAAGKNRQSE
jgi:hypothetical protein